MTSVREASRKRTTGSAGARIGRRAADAGGELVDLVLDAAENTLTFNPLIGIRGRDVLAAGGSLLGAALTSPRAATKHFGAYLRRLQQVLGGDCEIMSNPRDRRFADPAWQSNFLYRRFMQAHRVTEQSLSDFIEASSLDTRDKGRACFFASLLTDAFAPSNWLFGNPAAAHKIIDTGGANLIAGLKNMLHDARHNHLLPQQVDATPFRLGENVATTPGQVVHRSEMFELIQYIPSTSRVYARPLVMSPPQVNKYYAIDLTPEKSLAKWAVDSGVQLFVVSWRNPSLEHSHWGLEEYVQALDEAVDAARAITRSPDINVWGSCSGGMTLAAYLGWLAAKGDPKVVNTTWAVCVLDTEAAVNDSTLGLFNTPQAIRAAKARSRRRGLVSGEEMARMFAWLRPNDLIWNYWVNNYLLGNKPPAFDILFWNSDTTRLPGQFHCDLLELLESNPYAKAGRMQIDGLPVDLSNVDVGAYVIGGITDHITPWRACYGTARLFGPEATFVLANAGHLQSLINPPGAPKAHFLAAPASVADADDWSRRAQPHRSEGSWWPHCRNWIRQRSGELVDAPAKPGSRRYRPLCPAPGEYVHMK